MISYDIRAKNKLINMDYLKEERDEKEETRLNDIRIKMIPRVTIERELFEKFDVLQENIKEKFSKKKVKYRDLQIKSLHNKWAFWLDKISDKINNVYLSKDNEKLILNEFESFSKEINEKVLRNYTGIENLIDEPGELIKLAKFNIEEGNFLSAEKNCNHIQSKFGANFCAFSYYYKAMALLKPLKNKESEWNAAIDSYRKKCRGHILTYEEKENTIDLLKKAVILFERDIERIQSKSYIISNIDQKKNNTGVGSAADYFSKSNVNEITALTIHSNAAKSILSQEIVVSDLSQSFKGTILKEKDATNILEFIINHEKLTSYLKKERFSRKIKVKVHVDNLEKSKDKLKEIIGIDAYDQGVKNVQEYVDKQNIKNKVKFLIIDNISI